MAVDPRVDRQELGGDVEGPGGDRLPVGLGRDERPQVVVGRRRLPTDLEREDTRRTTGPVALGVVAVAAAANVRAWAARRAAVMGAAASARKAISSTANGGEAPMRQRSRNPQQPKGSRKTTDATSPTSWRASTSRHTRL